MKIETITLAKDQAKKEWAIYKETLRTHKDEYLKDTLKALSFLKRGIGVLDVKKLFDKVPLNKAGLPATAIAPAYRERITLNYYHNGQAEISQFSFKLSPFKEVDTQGYRVYSKRYQTYVPTIPPHLLPKGNLYRGKYYILWEVEDWEEVPRDPILLKRLTKNLFAVLAQWDLTPLEQAIIRGRIIR